ncbi:Cation/H+ exchanger [Penicillium odoratum]|uniref:Cation/H+ exchanger n=1 Tax=Penicillium odoratum TaxID=1167516 RepID=UPI002546F12B|nr:Cation/H+ exchanger [Penicillium odoratum]KAJ5745253.1 Cation/H+ exchanger [Penicillium odoratum]
MPTLSLINFNIVCATLGGFVSLFGLVSYLCKERFYLSEALISLLAGVAFSPHAANFIRPEDYALHSSENLAAITLNFTRLVLGVQLVLAGVQLPKRYLQIEWRSLSLLLGPGMAAMWICSSLVIWAMVPNFKFLHALIVAACVTPTDPVLSNSIVKGKFADKHVPRPLQRIIIAESGANDGLGYPFLFFGIYLMKYVGMGGEGYSGGAGKAIGMWFYETWAYTIVLSVVYGAVVGWLSRELLHWAEEKHYVDRESFLVFAIALALFVVGTCGLIGTDDLLACFIAGNVFTQDDWFRLETIDDSLQPTIDMLLNLSMFMWFGAVCPWSSFLKNDIIPIYRLIVLGILILLVRRMPVIFAMHKYIHQIEDLSHAAFVGFFGPIGVGAIFYLSICRETLLEIKVNGQVREDAQQVADTAEVVVWFLAICSIIVHGLSVPVGKAGYNLPRTLSTAITATTTEEDQPVAIQAIRHTRSTATPLESDAASFRSRRRRQCASPNPPIFRIGRSKIPEPSPSQAQPGTGQTDEPERPVNLVIHEPVTSVGERSDDSSTPN